MFGKLMSHRCNIFSSNITIVCTETDYSLPSMIDRKCTLINENEKVVDFSINVLIRFSEFI